MKALLILLALLLTACQNAPSPTTTPSTTPASPLTATTESPTHTPKPLTPDLTSPPPTLEPPTQTTSPNFSTFSEWDTRAPLLEPNSEFAVTELDGKIYVIGGYPSSRVTVSTVQVYDSATDSWTLASPVPVPVNHTMAASVNGKVYVIGGQSTATGSGPFLDTVFEFDPATNTWASRTSMPTARGGGAAAVIDGKIYVVGGRPPAGSDFAVYNPVLDAWETLPDLPTQRNHLAAVAVGGKLVVIGGRFEGGFQSEMTDAVEVFDPQMNTWATGSPMPTVRGGLNAVAVNGCIHVFGGEGPGGVFSQHEAYDPLTDSWYTFPNMATPVHGVTGAAYINGWIHLPGGGTEVGGSSGSTLHQVVRVEMMCGE